MASLALIWFPLLAQDGAHLLELLQNDTGAHSEAQQLLLYITVLHLELFLFVATPFFMSLSDVMKPIPSAWCSTSLRADNTQTSLLE